jgi:predicted N-acetyltransferase YhbS
MHHLVMPVIRPERPEDASGIRNVNLKAFDTPLEANLVDELRLQADPIAYRPKTVASGLDAACCASSRPS